MNVQPDGESRPGLGLRVVASNSSHTEWGSEMDTLEHNGRIYAVEILPDEHHGAPWEEEDGHGPVSGWTRRDKAPGEMVLCKDRGMRRLYDFAEACRIARRDGWGFLPFRLTYGADDPTAFQRTSKASGGWAKAGPFEAYDPDNFNAAISKVYAAHRATMTARQYAAAAAMSDFERLRRYCEGDWHYVGVNVTAVCDCCNSPTGESASLWGIESDAGDYLDKVARELAEELDARRFNN